MASTSCQGNNVETTIWFVLTYTKGAHDLWRRLNSDRRYAVLRGCAGTYGGQGDLLEVTFMGEVAQTPDFEGYVRELGNEVNRYGNSRFGLELVCLPRMREIKFPHHIRAQAERDAVFEGLPPASATPLDICPI
jgi:hypothetical protein